MRGYALSHFLLMPLQKGLQSNHAICRIRSALRNEGLAANYDDWEKNHTTLIYLNGGFSRDLKEAYEKLLFLNPSRSTSFMFPIPWADFREDEDTMEGMRTAIAMIIHPRYYAAMSCYRQDEYFFDTYFALTDPDRCVGLGNIGSGGIELLQEAIKYEKEKYPDSIFENYTNEEIEFITLMSKFNLAS